MQEWIDVSIPITKGMITWPGDPAVKIEKLLDIDRGDIVNVSSMLMSTHCGTHMDAPAHYIRGGGGIDSLPLDSLTGYARIIEVMDTDLIRPENIMRSNIGEGERLLFKTRNSLAQWWKEPFKKDFAPDSRRRPAACREKYQACGHGLSLCWRI
jgi:arylformamidase